MVDSDTFDEARRGDDELREAIRVGHERRDLGDMQPTLDYLGDLLARYPAHPLALYAMGGALDTAGHETEAASYYEQALTGGLDGEELRGLLLGYGSTLRNLGRLDESLVILRRAHELTPDSEAIRIFLALTLHAAGRSDAAVGQLMVLAADRIDSPHITRYERSIRGYAADLLEQDERSVRTLTAPTARRQATPGILRTCQTSAPTTRPAFGTT